jgi:hypothetical protein
MVTGPHDGSTIPSLELTGFFAIMHSVTGPHCGPAWALWRTECPGFIDIHIPQKTCHKISICSPWPSILLAEN